MFNNFAALSPLLLSHAFLIEKKVATRVVLGTEIGGIDNITSLKNRKYRCRTNINREDIDNFYRMIDTACGKQKTLPYALERYNTSLLRKDIYDRILDIAISLESLISGNNELSFRLALYCAFISKKNKRQRQEAFDLVRLLYKARSAIVHGSISSNSSIEKIEQNWESIKKLAIGAMNYYLIYLSSNKKEDWDSHLKKLLFGNTKRVID